MIAARRAGIRHNATVAFTDDFNRADSTTTLGAPWTARSGVWGISSNKAYLVTAGSIEPSAVYAAITMPCAAGIQDLSVDLSVSVSTNMGLVFGWVDSSNFYFLNFQVGTGGGTFRKIVGNSRITDTNFTSPSSTAFTARVTYNKSTGAIVVYQAGSSVFTTTDSALQGTEVGLLGREAGRTASNWDNFIMA